MPTFNSPRIYVDEPSGMPQPLTGVATSITAFVGHTRLGEPDKAVAIASFYDFERTYGGLDQGSPTSYAVRQFFANGGSRAIVVRTGAGEIVGSPGDKTGIYALNDVDLFNILCIPDTHGIADDAAVAVVRAAVALCEQRRAFYIVDAPAHRTLADVAQWANAATQSHNAAVYFPAVLVADPLDGQRPRAIAPSGTLAGVYARTDAASGVWKAPAGTSATLQGVLDLTTPTTAQDSERLNPLGINMLRNLPGRGCVAWGARTLGIASMQAKEFRYISVRRLTLFLEESLHRGTQWTVFEPNGEPLWARLRQHIETFLFTLWRQGAFQGTTAQQAYFVQCNQTTTPAADLGLGVVNVLVGFAAIKPAEFMLLRIQCKAGPPRA